MSEYNNAGKNVSRKVCERFTAVMRDKSNAAEIDRLCTYFKTERGIVKAVDGVSFDLPYGKTVCVVGESGCGKSVTALTLMRLLSEVPPHSKHRGAYIAGGQIRLDTPYGAIDITKADRAMIRRIRGGCVSMIFQEPMTALNPVFRIGRQLDEAVLLHNPDITSRKAAQNRSAVLLEKAGIPDPGRVYRMYPHQLSGGMRQRVMTAMALAGNVRLLIADEPTTALDVTVQAQILSLIRELKDSLGTAVMFVTHDLGVVEEIADYVVVMYAGRIVERGRADEIFADPRHPYTVGLMRSRPDIAGRNKKLYSIPGTVPVPIDLPDRCCFLERCERARAVGCKECSLKYPPEIKLTDTHSAACYAAHIKEAVR